MRHSIGKVASDTDNAPAVFHYLRGALHGGKHRFGVDSHLPVIIVQRKSLNRPCVENPSVVDEDIESSPPFFDVSDSLLYGLGLRRIDLHGPDFCRATTSVTTDKARSQFSRQLFGLCTRALIGECDLGALLCEFAHNGRPNSARAAGDKGGFILK